MRQERVPGSFRDPSGFLFESEGTLLRQVNKKYRIDYERLMTSGLYKKLVGEGLMVGHEEVDFTLRRTDDAFKIIRPERVPFVSYPYEWCFSALKDAALITLEIQKKALAHEMSLKDASAFNVQFMGGKPVFIDTLSFERYREGQPWVAYKQFCMHFLAPLALMSYRDVRLNGWLKVSVDGFPLDLASELLPLRTKLRFSLLSHIHMHAKTQQRFAGKTVDKSRKNIKKFAMRAIIDSLENAVDGLKWSAAGTEWADYYLDTNYSKDGMQHKMDLVSDFLAEISPETVWDFGANEGTFSRIASGKGIQTISFDIDPVCVEQNYLDVRNNSEPNLLPLLFDAMNPTPNLGWANMERMSVTSRGPCDTLMALALIHHLAISNNVPLHDISQYFGGLCRWLIVEFVPKEDSQVQRLLSTREDIFPNYNQEHFEEMFSQDFRIASSVKLRDSKRVLYLMKALGKS